MQIKYLRGILLPGLLLSLSTGCDWNKPAPSDAPATPAPSSANPTLSSPQTVTDSSPTATAPNGQQAPRVPYTTFQGSINWPVTLPLDKKHHAIDIHQVKMATAAGRGPLRMLESIEGNQLMRIANSDWRRVDNPAADSIWRVVNQRPSARPNPGTSNQAQVSRDGSRNEFYAASGTVYYWNADGSTTVEHGQKKPPGVAARWDANDFIRVRHTEPAGSTSINGAVNASVPDPGDPDQSVTTTYKDGSTLTTNDGDFSYATPPTTPSFPGDTGWAGKAEKEMDDGIKKQQEKNGHKGGTGTGEPHYLTSDGTNITTQTAGEFVLTTGGPGRELQVRQEPWRGTSETVSAITALAMRVGESKVEVRVDGTVIIDGRPAPDGGFVQGDVRGGGAVGVWHNGSTLVDALVVWPDLSAIWITPHNGYLNFVVQWHGEAQQHRGLLGSDDGNPANDLTDRAGKVFDAADAPGVASFCESWRITDAESLFTYGPGQSTATFMLPGFPKAPVNLSHTEEAKAAAASLPEGPMRDNLIYDIAATGDQTFVESYQHAAALLATVNAHATAASAASAAAPPAPVGDIAVTASDMTGAQAMEAGAKFKMTLGAGESRVYKFTPGKNDTLTIFSDQLAVRKKFEPGKEAGFAWFDDKGVMVGETHPVVNDGPTPLDHPTGTFYLKIVGPGDVEIHHF